MKKLEQDVEGETAEGRVRPKSKASQDRRAMEMIREGGKEKEEREMRERRSGRGTKEGRDRGGEVQG